LDWDETGVFGKLIKNDVRSFPEGDYSSPKGPLTDGNIKRSEALLNFPELFSDMEIVARSDGQGYRQDARARDSHSDLF
jgi:hypothetical protein